MSNKKIYTYKGEQYTAEKDFISALRKDNILAGSDLDSCADSVETVIDMESFIDAQEQFLQDKRDLNVDTGCADTVLDTESIGQIGQIIIELNSVNYQLVLAGRLSGRSSITIGDKNNNLYKLDSEMIDKVIEGWVEDRERGLNIVSTRENRYLGKISTLESARSDPKYLCAYIDDTVIQESHRIGSNEYVVIGERTNLVEWSYSEGIYEKVNPFIEMYYNKEE